MKQLSKSKVVGLISLLIIGISPCVNAQEDILFKTPSEQDIKNIFENSNQDSLNNIIVPIKSESTDKIIIHNQSGTDRVYKISSDGNEQEITTIVPVSSEAEDILFEQNLNANEYRIGILDKAIQLGDLNSLKFMNGVSANYETYNRNTMIHIAALRNNIELFKFALERKALIQKKNSDSWNFIHVASHSGNLDFLKKAKELVPLDTWKVLIRELDAQGRNMLHLASYNRNKDLISFLIQEGVSVNQKDKNGMTPAFYAIGLNEWSILNTYLINKADLLLKVDDKENESYEDVVIRRIPINDVALIINYLSDEKRKQIVKRIDKIVFSFKDDERFQKMP